jgi:hypothetical protein
MLAVPGTAASERPGYLKGVEIRRHRSEGGLTKSAIADLAFGCRTRKVGLVRPRADSMPNNRVDDQRCRNRRHQDRE